MSDDDIDLGIEDLTGAIEVGAGGFGTVYKAHQDSLRRDVAVKMVTSTVKDRKVRIRFEREIQAMGMLSGHPNIVTVYDSGFTASGQPYILMDYMDQGSLGDRIDRDGSVAWADVLPMMVKVCGALETAHQAGILHRDIKPENVLVSAYGEPKLGDFGIARLKGGPETGTSSLTASIEHVSPELLDAKAPSIASDIYAMGSTMFKLLTGHAAFIHPTDESIVPALTRIQGEPVPNLRETGVPDPVAGVVERAMAKDPDARFPTAAEMGQALRAAQAQLGLSTTVLPVRAEEAAAAKEATRTIHSDDLARSIDDIRRLGGQLPNATGPTPGVGPPPAATGGVGHPPPPSAPPGGAPPQGPAAGGYQPPGSAGMPPGRPGPTPQQGYASRPASGPGYQQPQPYAARPAPSATPWGKIAAGVGGLAVVVAIGVGVALSGGGEPTPTPTPTPRPVPTATTPEPDPTETTPPPPEDYDYTQVTNESGELQISVPEAWDQIDGAPWVVEGTEIGMQVVAAPDLNAFRTSWNRPGLIFGSSEQLRRPQEGRPEGFTTETLLDELKESFEVQCTYVARQPYADAAYTGHRDDYTECGGTTTRYTIVATEPLGGGDLMLLLQFQAVEERDDGALDQALATFVQAAPSDGAS